MVCEVVLLCWLGCIVNVVGFVQVFGDDVVICVVMFESWFGMVEVIGGVGVVMILFVQIYCEVLGEVV